MLLLWLLNVIAQVLSLENGLDRGTTSCENKHESVKIFVEKGDFGYIVSHGYPDNYTVSQYQGHSCNVEIRSCGTCRLRLQLIEIEFPDCPSQKKTRHRNLCTPGCDHLQIHEVDQPYHGVSKKNFHGNDDGDTYVSLSSNVRIRHCMSNGTVIQGKKFRIKYEVIEKREEIQGTVSSAQMKENKGYIKSPNFPSGYALNGETFTYMLQNLDPYGHIKLVFDDWDIAKESWIQVYDGVSQESDSQTFDRSIRPILVSESSTLIVVFNTGRSKDRCCKNIGFKATYEFFSEKPLSDKPDTNCSLMIDSKPGGRIELNHAVLDLPGLYDCIWIIKPNKAKNPDGILLRIEEVIMGEGWLQVEKNSLEIRSGITSTSPTIAKYTSNNMTLGEWFSPDGYYIRLRAGLYTEDKIKLIFTSVDNITDVGCRRDTDYLCHNLWCIDRDLMCDGIDNCGDNSDESPELICSVSDFWKLGIRWSITDKETTMNPCSGNFRCTGDSLCIPLSNVCDRYIDCSDRSDEIYCPYYKNSSVQSHSVVHLRTLMLLLILANVFV